MSGVFRAFIAEFAEKIAEIAEAKFLRALRVLSD